MQGVGHTDPAHVPVGLRLKYLALKNIAAIAVVNGDLNKAISFYVQVCSPFLWRVTGGNLPICLFGVTSVATPLSLKYGNVCQSITQMEVSGRIVHNYEKCQKTTCTGLEAGQKFLS